MSVYKTGILFYNIISKFSKQTNAWRLFNMKRLIAYIPETKGIYGIRVLIPERDEKLRHFVEPICLWGGPTDTRIITSGDHYGEHALIYELPFGIECNPLWKRAVEYFNIEFVK
jgi:hypothetical protein